MSDSDRISALEEQVRVLLGNQDALRGCLKLLVDLLRTLEAERKYRQQPSLVDMLENAIVVRQTNDGFKDLPDDVRKAEEFALAVITTARIAPEPEPGARG